VPQATSNIGYTTKNFCLSQENPGNTSGNPDFWRFAPLKTTGRQALEFQRGLLLISFK